MTDKPDVSNDACNERLVKMLRGTVEAKNEEIARQREEKAQLRRKIIRLYVAVEALADKLEEGEEFSSDMYDLDELFPATQVVFPRSKPKGEEDEPTR